MEEHGGMGAMWSNVEQSVERLGAIGIDRDRSWERLGVIRSDTE